MLRAPLSLEKMSYDAATGSVIYRSKMHVGLKRNFQMMSGAEWLELLCRRSSTRLQRPSEPPWLQRRIDFPIVSPHADIQG